MSRFKIQQKKLAVPANHPCTRGIFCTWHLAQSIGVSLCLALGPQR